MSYYIIFTESVNPQFSGSFQDSPPAISGTFPNLVRGYNVAMQIKLPAIYDVSHWKIVPDFKQVNPRPLAVFTKATEGLEYVDKTFERYFADLKQDGITRGCYHFFRKTFDAVKQAQHFLNTIENHIDPHDVLILDVEEGGEKASQLWSWFHTVRSQFPNHQYLLYSRKNILDPIVMTQGEKDYFKQIPVWTAGYPFLPDMYSAPPAGYIPDQSKFGPVWVWQYTDKGKVEGISGDVDCNWVDPVFAAILEKVYPVPPQPSPEPSKGTLILDGKTYDVIERK